MTRFLAVACCTMIALPAWGQFVRSPRGKPGIQCPLRPAECQINAQVFDFGRGQMTSNSPPINGTNTVSVTCTRAPLDGLSVQVDYNLKAVPAEPARQMRDNNLLYLGYEMFVDPARTRYWGDGYTYGTFTFQGVLSLDDRNRVGTLAHVVYGRVPGAQASLHPPGQWLGLVGLQLEYTALCLGN
jgi:spore coat protein U-like protein